MDIKESPLVSSELIFLRIFSVPNGNEYSTIIFHDRVIINQLFIQLVRRDL